MTTTPRSPWPPSSSTSRVENATADRGTTDDGWVISIPGDTLHYTLAFTMTNGPLHGVVITDVLPAGLGAPSNISDGGTWDADTRTITWDLGTLEADGVVSYDVVVASGADKLEQPLENVATIDSDETSPDDDDADTKVVSGGDVETETSKPTLPPTDTVGPARAAAGRRDRASCSCSSPSRAWRSVPAS